MAHTSSISQGGSALSVAPGSPVPPPPRVAQSGGCAPSGLVQCSGVTPFSEWQVSEDDLKKHLDKMREQGFFSLPMQACTREFLCGLLKNGSFSSHPVLPPRCIMQDLDCVGLINDFAAKALGALGVKGSFSAHEIEIRKTLGAGEVWHIDSPPKLLTCVAVLRGKPTEYVTQDVARSHFENKNPDGRFPWHVKIIEGTVLAESDISYFPEDHFVFFAAHDLPGVEKIIHRAPGGDPDRAIFLARWKPDRNPFLER